VGTETKRVGETSRLNGARGGWRKEKSAGKGGGVVDGQDLEGKGKEERGGEVT